MPSIFFGSLSAPAAQDEPEADCKLLRGGPAPHHEADGCFHKLGVLCVGRIIRGSVVWGLHSGP